MTLTELDQLKKDNPKRYYRFYFFMQERIKKEVRKIEKMKEGQGGDSDILTFTKENPTFLSEIEEMD